jgi:hypothetical protein
MADDQGYSTFVSGEDEASRLLKKILSPAEAQSLVLPPPNLAPVSGPGESTPLTGSLAKPPSQAIPSRALAYEEGKRKLPEPGMPMRRGLAGYFASASTADGPMAAAARGEAAPDRSGDPRYVKVFSNGQVGYLPKANLQLARQIDVKLKVLNEA